MESVQHVLVAKLFIILLVAGALVDQLASKEPPLLIDPPAEATAR